MTRASAEDASGRRRFERLRVRYAEVLAALGRHDEPRFVRSDWQARNRALVPYLMPSPPGGFLCHPAIRYQMFVGERMLPWEWPYVRCRLPRLELAAEDAVGEPPSRRVEGVLTSSNTVHHLHHLLRYEGATGRDLRTARTVVEWGGGYGNLAKLFLRLHGGTPTYVLVDTPVFAALQWLYLASVLGEDLVKLVPGTGEVTPGAVNIVPVGLSRRLEVDADLFVSTWALNESTRAAQDHVVERGWFGASGLLVAMHRGDPFEPTVLAAGARPQPLGHFLPGQHYFVR